LIYLCSDKKKNRHNDIVTFILKIRRNPCTALSGAQPWRAVFCWYTGFSIGGYQMLPTLEKATTVAVVNKQQIMIVPENGAELVPIRPICEALGIDFSSQLKRLKRDEILNSTVVTVTTVGGDEKNREMVAIPLKFTFGWLFTIEVNQVKEEAREAVLHYQLECYNALYNYFTSFRDYDRWRNEQLIEALAEYDREREVFNQSKDRMKTIRQRIDNVRTTSYEDFQAMRQQLNLDFPE
jgi:hypothetical protein